MSDSFDALRPYLKRRDRLYHIISLLNYDLSTATPQAGLSDQGELVNSLAGEAAAIYKEPSFIEAVKKAHEANDLNRRQKAVVDKLYEEIEFYEKVDLETYMGWMEAISKSNEIWRSAKANNDFALFLPYWEKAVAAAKEMALVRKKDIHKSLYDVCLDQYEKGLTSEKLDAIFAPLKDFLVSSLPLVLEKQERVPLVKIPFIKADRQRAFSYDVINLIGYDLNRGVMRESMHPFTDCPAKDDVRITTRILEEDFRSNL